MLTEWQKRKLEAEASGYPTIEVLGFASRGKLVVLQTSEDNFETMNSSEKLNFIDYSILSLQELRRHVSAEDAREEK